MSAFRLVLFIAFRQLYDRKVLNGIAVMGVALGVVTLVVLSAIMRGFQVKFQEEIAKVSPHVVVSERRLGAEKSTFAAFAGTPVAADIAGERPDDKTAGVARPGDLIAAFQAMPEVEGACATLRGQAIATLGSQQNGVDMRGVRPDEQERCTPVAGYISAGSWHTLSSTRDGVVLGSGLAMKLGAHMGDRVNLGSPGGVAQSLVVVAILDVGIPAIDNIRAYVNLSTSQSILHRTNAVGSIEIRIFEPFTSVAFAKRVELISGYESEGWQETNANFLSLFDMQNTIVGIVVAAILALGGFGILSTQIMIVLQKTRDIAILRSIGFRRGDILFAVMVQGAAVAFLGAIIGNLGGWRAVEMISVLPMQSDGLIKSSVFIVHRDPWVYAWGSAFALFVGLTASAIPAFRASRVQPVDVLRGQVT